MGEEKVSAPTWQPNDDTFELDNMVNVADSQKKSLKWNILLRMFSVRPLRRNNCVEPHFRSFLPFFVNPFLIGVKIAFSTIVGL